MTIVASKGYRHAMDYWAYMVRCADGSYYVGSHRGSDPEDRVAGHNAGLDPKTYTFHRRPVRLIWAEWFQSPWDMIDCERQLKGWSRAKKEALARGDPAALRRLARGRSRPPKEA